MFDNTKNSVGITKAEVLKQLGIDEEGGEGLKFDRLQDRIYDFGVEEN